MTCWSCLRIFPANFVARSTLDVFPSFASMSQWIVAVSSRQRQTLPQQKCIWLALHCALSSLALRGFYVTIWCLFHYTKIDTVSLCGGRKHCATPTLYCEFASCSGDAPFSAAGLIIFSNFCTLQIGEGSPVSSLLALGRLPQPGRSNLRHFVSHLWSFNPHRKGPLLCSRRLFHLFIPVSCQSNYFPQRK